jgi:hypothetical protein
MPHEPPDGIGIGGGLEIQLLVREIVSCQLDRTVLSFQLLDDKSIQIHRPARHIGSFFTAAIAALCGVASQQGDATLGGA